MVHPHSPLVKALENNYIWGCVDTSDFCTAIQKKNPNNPISKERVTEKSVTVIKETKTNKKLETKASEESRIMAEFWGLGIEYATQHL